MLRKYRIIIPLVLLAFSVVLVTKEAVPDPVSFVVRYAHLTKETKIQIDCLAKNIYHEAGGESKRGKEAVAFVTINRTYDSKFPKDICAVVKQKTNTVCQFSWFCTKVSIQNVNTYNESRDVAVNTYINYEKINDITHGALFYHADYVDPNWKLKKTAVIGRHIFYKESSK